MNAIELDFKQAKAKHLLFESRLRSILYDIAVDEGPVLSHHECGVGQWIYGHALAAYGHLPEMVELERVHADIHTSARRLVALYRAGQAEEARQGLSEMEQVADHLVVLLGQLESQLQHAAPADVPAEAYISLSLRDFQEILRTNQQPDRRSKEQVAQTAHATERCNLIARATHDVVWDWDLKTNGLRWSNGFLTTFGYAPEQVDPTIESWTSYIHSNDHARADASIHAAIAQREPRWTEEYRFQRADGTYAQVLDWGYVLYDIQTKEPLRMVGSMTGLTQQVELTAALRESQTMFQTITDASPVGLFRTNDDGQVVYANQTVLDWLGMSMAQYLANAGAEAIVAEDLPNLTARYAAAFAARQPYTDEVRIHHADGTVHVCQLASVPRIGAGGAFTGYVGSFFDITDRKATEDQLKRHYDDLELKATFRNLELERQVRDLQRRVLPPARSAGDNVPTGGA
ncbi:MAG: PAS domain-containing protein [Hymenobacteraceae bacterium]|nr:PAS domain-containing protein [Hymenobacteraceae bacterium]